MAQQEANQLLELGEGQRALDVDRRLLGFRRLLRLSRRALIGGGVPATSPPARDDADSGNNPVNA